LVMIVELTKKELEIIIEWFRCYENYGSVEDDHRKVKDEILIKLKD